ncbi:sigma-70 family RNA polymerase sigma factor [candidate division KSB1 bacterium]|nr:sigma-70 family RNA polymerase sigma factor [candidate division KSB1 bacterium]
MDRNEELLIKRAQRGNIEAFEELIQQYDARIMKVTYDMLNNVEDARDVYQDIFIKVYRAISKFRFQSEFYTWLFRIAINTCINYRKKRTKNRGVSLDELQEKQREHWELTGNPEEIDPEKHVLNEELNETINQGIRKLSNQQRAVFVLRHYHGYKLRQIAEILECSEGTVKNYLFRATKKMQEMLSSYHKI